MRGAVVAVAVMAVAVILAGTVPAVAQEPGVTGTDSLRLRVEAPDIVERGVPVPLRLVVENAARGAVDVHLTGRSVAFDLEVVDAGGREVWRRLEGEVVSMVLQIRTLAPGERLVFEAVWDQRTNAGRRAPPGVYRVRGLLPTDAPEPLTTPWVEVRIGEG